MKKFSLPNENKELIIFIIFAVILNILLVLLTLSFLGVCCCNYNFVNFAKLRQQQTKIKKIERIMIKNQKKNNK